MYAATTKDEGNAADGRFSTACLLYHPHLIGYFLPGRTRLHIMATINSVSTPAPTGLSTDRKPA